MTAQDCRVMWFWISMGTSGIQTSFRWGVGLSLAKLYNTLWPWRAADFNGELGEELERMDKL